MSQYLVLLVRYASADGNQGVLVWDSVHYRIQYSSVSHPLKEEVKNHLSLFRLS
jgi:hypothetical protein